MILVMNKLIDQWKKDEQAKFEGWDFSYLKNRWIDEKPPWDYKQQAKKSISNASSVLDMGTGGGEIFSSFAPFPKHAVAIEGWKPNVHVAKKRLEPLGVKVIEVDESNKLPFADEEFDLVINRHSAFQASELFRILKPKGIFLTQQVGGGNLNDLITEFSVKSKFKSWSLDTLKGQLQEADFIIEEAQDWTGKVIFKDVGAIVYFLKAVPWVVEGFSVDSHLSYLQKLQKRLERGGELSFVQVRFIVRARKP